MWSPSQATKLRIAKRRSSITTSINVWPFAVVMLALLIMFMSNTTPHHWPRWAGVDLPRARYATTQPGARREDAMFVVVSRDGKVYFRSTHVAPDDLPYWIGDALREGSEPKVYVAADARAKYGDVGAVVDQIQRAGIQNICFLGEKITAQ